MIMEYAKVYVDQKVEVYDEFQLSGCLTDFTESCDLTGWPQFEDYGFSYRTTADSALPWDEIRQQIDSNKPFAFSEHDDGGGGHMRVAVGYIGEGGERDVVYHEPLNNGDTYYMSYDRFAGAPRQHWDDFYDIRRTGYAVVTRP